MNREKKWFIYSLLLMHFSSFLITFKMLDIFPFWTEIEQIFMNAVIFKKNESLNSSIEFALSIIYAVEEMKNSVTGT